MNKEFNLLLNKFIKIIEKLENWERKTINNNVNDFINNNKIKFISFGKPLRIVLINSENGPSISDIMYIFGKKECILRLNNYIKG